MFAFRVIPSTDTSWVVEWKLVKGVVDFQPITSFSTKEAAYAAIDQWQKQMQELMK